MTTGLGTAAAGSGLSDRRLALVGTGVTTAIAFGIFAPVIYYMVAALVEAVDDYSHGFLIAPLSALLRVGAPPRS